MTYPPRRTPRSRRGNGGPAPTYPSDPNDMRYAVLEATRCGMRPGPIAKALNMLETRVVEIIEEAKRDD